jgi:hypothetical protein
MRIAQERNEEKAGGLLHNLNHYLLSSNESKLREILKRFNKKAGLGRVNIKIINLFLGCKGNQFKILKNIRRYVY